MEQLNNRLLVGINKVINQFNALNLLKRKLQSDKERQVFDMVFGKHPAYLYASLLEEKRKKIEEMIIGKKSIMEVFNDIPKVLPTSNLINGEPQYALPEPIEEGWDVFYDLFKQFIELLSENNENEPDKNNK